MNDKKKIQINRNERYALGLSFIYFFCVLAAYYIVRPVREQLSAELGSAELPAFFAATFFATLALTPIFAWLVSRWPRRIVVPLVYLFFICCELAFTPFFMNQNLHHSRTLGLVFFVWVSVFNLFVVSVFWSFMTDIWSDCQARRLFPIIALGGTLGAIIGPFITRESVEFIGIGFLLIISAILLAIAGLCVLFLGRWASKHGVHRFEADSEEPVGGGMFDGLKQIFANPFIRSMALIMLLSDGIGTIAYVLLIDYSGSAFPDAVARTQFAAGIDMSTNILQVIVQLTLTRWLLIRGGAGPVIVVWAIICILTCLFMSLASDPYTYVFGTMPWVALTVIMTRSLSYGMVKLACETLFTLVPRDLRYKGKNAVDTAVWRAGDLASSLAINGLRAVGVSIQGFGLIGAGLIAISGIIGRNLANRVEKGSFEK